MKRKQEEKWQSKLGTRALNPLQVLELQDAIRGHQEVVTLEGREFTLVYYHTSEGEKVRYAPVEGFVPTGHLDIKRFLED